MEEDRLRIRKDREEPSIFHYSREERLSLPGAPKPPLQEGFFRRNRSLTIVLLDILILIIVGFGVYLFLGRTSHQAKISGYSVVLHGILYQDVVFASLTVKKIKNEPTIPPERIFISFTMSKSEEELSLSAQLPVKPGEETVLREAIPFEKNNDTLYAYVSVGEKSIRLSRDLKR